MKFFSTQIARFGSVGLIATVVHYVSAVALIAVNTDPLVANAIAFLIAFFVSFTGHYYWSFPKSGLLRRVALIRFLVVALAGFVLNELLLASFLRWTVIPIEILLLIVLIQVAGMTFIGSRLWAFRNRGKTEGVFASGLH